jgi:glycosyltransferase involved in cell wall biosynthesis
MVRRFLADPADCHVYARAPGPALAKKPRCLIYDCMDDWAGFPGALSDVLDREQELCEMADRIWVVSKYLENRLSRFARKVQYVPNGVNFDHFARVPRLKHDCKRQSSRPVLGYMGALFSWFDAALVGNVARLLKDWSIVLIGPIELTTNQRRELDHPNIQLRGVCPYESLPTFIAEMDVAMIPFSISDLTKGTSPIKLYEYLAAALPVVATPMPEVLSFVEPGVVACAESPTSFANAVQQLFAGRRPDRCQEIAKQHSWRQRFTDALGMHSTLI